MDTNEIITEEVIETVEEAAEITGSSCKGLNVVTGVGFTLVCGFIVYKYVAKPILTKLKSKKAESKIIDTEAEETDEVESEPNEESET